MYVAIGRHPNHATGFDDADLAELKALAAHPRCRAIGETGLDFYRDDRLARGPGARLRRAHASSRATTGKPLVIHTRAADDDTLVDARRPGRGPRGDPALLLDARPARRVPRARLLDLVRRQRHLSATPRCAPPRARSPPSACWSRPTRPTSRRRPCARSATSRRTSTHTAEVVAAERGVSVRGAGGAGRAQRRRAVRLVSDAAHAAHAAAPAGSSAIRPEARPRPELPDRLEHPRRDRAGGGARPADVVLEIGGGLGVLSEHLAERVRARARRRGRPRAGAGAARRARPVRRARDAAPRRRDDARPARAASRRRRRSSRTCRTGSPPARSCARSRSCRA